MPPEETIALTVRCMHALYHWQVLQGGAMAQVIGTARTSREIVTAQEEQIADLNAQIDQLEVQVDGRDTLLGESHAHIILLEQQLNALQVQVDDALDHIEHLEALQAPPQAMEEEEPQEIQGVSKLDTVSGLPMPPPQGAHSPVRSEASVNDLDDF